MSEGASFLAYQLRLCEIAGESLGLPDWLASDFRFFWLSCVVLGLYVRTITPVVANRCLFSMGLRAYRMFVDASIHAKEIRVFKGFALGRKQAR